MNKTAKNLIKAGWSVEEAKARAAVIEAAKAGPCQCQYVRHLPGDNRCPASRYYTPPADYNRG